MTDLEGEMTRRWVLISGIAGVALTVLVVIGIVISQAVGGTTRATEDQRRPPSATDQHGIELVSHADQAAQDAPHLIIFQDYQCPLCAQLEGSYGDAVLELVDTGRITAELRTAHFLDNNVPGDASKRAAMSVAAADEVGFLRQYHRALYSHQSSGYPQELLRDTLPDEIGMDSDSLAVFQQLYDERAFNDFVDASNDAFNDGVWTGTPVYEVAGLPLEFIDHQTREVLIQPTAEDLLRAIEALSPGK